METATPKGYGARTPFFSRSAPTMRATRDELPELLGAAIRGSDWGDLRSAIVSLPAGTDVGPLLKGLPDDRCPCPHWGYVIRGRVVVRYDDHEEILGPGDAFYMAPGHAPEAEEGTELVQFSPTEQLAEVEAAIAAAIQA